MIVQAQQRVQGMSGSIVATVVRAWASTTMPDFYNS